VFVTVITYRMVSPGFAVVIVAPVLGFVALFVTVKAGFAVTHVSVWSESPVTLTRLMMSNEPAHGPVTVG
jgi:hypothetical protein